MVVVPVETAVIFPNDDPIVATVVLLLLHEPPAVVSLNEVVSPEQILETPVIAPGEGFTVTVARTVHPPAEVKVTVAVPRATPLTMPVADPIVAILVLDALHVPPGSDRAVVEPAHKENMPVIAGGGGLMISFFVRVLVQPFASVTVSVTG